MIIEYILVGVICFSAGVHSTKKKHKTCEHSKVVIVKHRPWYALHIDGFHFHNKKHKRKWKKRYRESLKFKHIHYWGGKH
jgi:hypothetical protein